MRRFGALVEQAPGPRVPVTTTVLPSAGIHARVLHDLAEREEASLIVFGSSRRGHVGRVLPSAVTDRLLHGAPCPVAVAPRGFSFADADGGPRLVGVAFTDTPDGRAALARACILAARARGLVRVLTVTEPLEPLMSGALEPAVLDYVRSARDERAATVLRRGLDAVSAGRSAGGDSDRPSRSRPCGGLGRPRSTRLWLARVRPCPDSAARRNVPRVGAQGGMPGARRPARPAGVLHHHASTRRARPRGLTPPSMA
jgi:nucleotide-binding universal stress UspA family protein